MAKGYPFTFKMDNATRFPRIAGFIPTVMRFNRVSFIGFWRHNPAINQAYQWGWRLRINHGRPLFKEKPWGVGKFQIEWKER